MNKIAVTYTRVSSKEQVDEGHSLDSQARQLSEYAAANGYKIVELFVERGESAKTTNRPELRRLLEYIAQHKGELDALLLYKVDRLSRDTHDYLALKQVFEKNGIAVVSITENFEDTPIGRVMETIASGFAQYDNEVRAERSKNGMIEGVRQGRWMWQAPTGYINAKVNGDKNIALDPREGYCETLKAAWSLIDAGYRELEAWRIVNSKLAELGYEPVPIQTFSKMFKRKLYIGIVEAFDMSVQSKTIVPLVEADLFYRVQDILSGNRNRGKVYSKINPEFPLRGVLWCKNGHKMTGSASRGNGGRYPKYHCPKCKGLGVSYDVPAVEEQFISYASQIAVKNDVREALKEAIRLNLGDTQRQNEKQTNTLKKRLMTIKAEKRELTQKNIKGIVPDKTAQELFSEYELEETEIRLKLNHLETGVEDVEDLLEFGLDKLSDVAQTFQEIGDPFVRSRFQKWLFPAGLSYDGQKFGTSQIPLFLSIKKDLSAEKSLLVSLIETNWNLICEEINRWLKVIPVNKGLQSYPVAV